MNLNPRLEQFWWRTEENVSEFFTDFIFNFVFFLNFFFFLYNSRFFRCSPIRANIHSTRACFAVNFTLPTTGSPRPTTFQSWRWFGGTEASSGEPWRHRRKNPLDRSNRGHKSIEKRWWKISMQHKLCYHRHRSHRSVLSAKVFKSAESSTRKMFLTSRELFLEKYLLHVGIWKRELEDFSQWNHRFNLKFSWADDNE